MTDGERDVMEHATGWRTKTPLYRNRYVASDGHPAWATLHRLVDEGLMEVVCGPTRDLGGSSMFAVTDAGIEALRAPSGTGGTP